MRGAPGRAKRAANSTTVPTKPSRIRENKVATSPVHLVGHLHRQRRKHEQGQEAAPAGNPPAVQQRIAVA